MFSKVKMLSLGCAFFRNMRYPMYEACPCRNPSIFSISCSNTCSVPPRTVHILPQRCGFYSRLRYRKKGSSARLPPPPPPPPPEFWYTYFRPWGAHDEKWWLGEDIVEILPNNATLGVSTLSTLSRQSNQQDSQISMETCRRGGGVFVILRDTW